MNERKLFQSGITLIALVITIIVMLILAGVSLNATIGDNGIITQAQNATYMQSIAALEEYLQTEYVKYYDETENYTSKIELLSSKIGNLCLKDGTKNYITYDGKMYYLINKQNLPDDVRNQLKGGDTTEYLKYIRLQDVYGVTPDLKVYYCESGTDSALGTLDSTELDPTTPLKKINQDAEMKSAITEALESIGVTVGENGVTVGDASKLKNIELDGSKHNITSISGLSELSSLKTVTLSNLTLSNLDGLQNCTLLYYVYFKNCKINDYSNLSTVLDLQYLYLYLPPSMSEADANAQVNNLGNGLANATELKKLEYFGIAGTKNMFEGNYSVDTGADASSSKFQYSLNEKSNITNINNLNKINSSIKNTIKYVYLNNNSFKSIETLQDFTNIYELDVMCCSNLLDLKGLENHENLVYLFAQQCNLQNVEGLKGGTKLKYICLRNNINLQSLNGLEDAKTIDYLIINQCNIIDITALENNIKLRYLDLVNNSNLQSIIALKNCTGIKKLYLAGNINMIGTEVRDALADPTTHILQNCGANYSIPSKYNMYFTTLTSYDYSNLGLTDDSDEINSLKNKTNVTRLNLSGNSNLSNEKLQEILSTMTGLKALSLNGCKNLETIDFIGEGKVNKLIELDLRGTSNNLIDLSNLDNSKTLMTLLINNTHVELNKIQNLINNMSTREDKTSDYKDSIVSKGYWWEARGIVLNGNFGAYSFENCNEITSWFTGWSGGYGNLITGTLDLSSLSNLKSFFYGSTSIPIKLPKKLQYLNICVGQNVDLSECTDLITINLSNNTGWKNFDVMNYNINSTKLKNVITAKGCSKDFKFLKNVKESDINISISEATDGVDFLESLEGLPVNSKNLNISRAILLENVDALKEKNSLENISINNTKKMTKVDLSGCLNLKSLFLRNGNLSVITGLEKIENLQKVYLDNNKITDITVFKSSKNLTDLNLSSNNITDLSSLEGLIDEAGKTKLKTLNLSDNLLQTVSVGGHNNVETLKKLYNAGLRTLDISGNNFTAGSTEELKNLKWNGYKE